MFFLGPSVLNFDVDLTVGGFLCSFLRLDWLFEFTGPGPGSVPNAVLWLVVDVVWPFSLRLPIGWESWLFHDAIWFGGFSSWCWSSRCFCTMMAFASCKVLVWSGSIQVVFLLDLMGSVFFVQDSLRFAFAISGVDLFVWWLRLLYSWLWYMGRYRDCLY